MTSNAHDHPDSPQFTPSGGLRNPRLTDTGKAVVEAMRAIEEAIDAGKHFNVRALPDDVRAALVELKVLPLPAGFPRGPRSRDTDPLPVGADEFTAPDLPDSPHLNRGGKLPDAHLTEATWQRLARDAQEAPTVFDATDPAKPALPVHLVILALAVTATMPLVTIRYVREFVQRPGFTTGASALSATLTCAFTGASIAHNLRKARQ